MSEKILKTVFGGEGNLLNKNELRIVGQDTFLTLYKNHLSTAVTDVIAGFCINVGLGS